MSLDVGRPVCADNDSRYEFVYHSPGLSMGTLPACMSMRHMYAVPFEIIKGCQISGAVSYHVGTGKQTQVLWKNRQGCELLSHLSGSGS